MFAVKRIIRSKLNLKNDLYTSSLLRCDKPKDGKENKPKLKKKYTASTEPVTESGNASKNKLTAEVNAKDYANFKFRKSSKVELYSDENSQNEKLEAKKALKTFTSEIEKKDLNIPINKKFQVLSVGESKKVKAESEDKLVKSAKLVASELGGDVKKTEMDILGYLKTLQIKTEKRKFNKDNAGIKSEEKQTSRDFIGDREKYFRRSRPGFFRDRKANSINREEREISSHRTNQNNRGEMIDKSQFNKIKIGNFISSKDISGFEPLGVFKANKLYDDGPKLKIWDELKEWELKFEATIPPRNYFEELIQWTEEGKLWHFPIDNDQDNELEANVDFTEHIFLEGHLEPWCPKKGPLRHFMELVLTGLAKNYHLSVEEKKEHIYWYRDYFEGKKKLLQEMGALDSGKILPKSEESDSNPESSA